VPRLLPQSRELRLQCSNLWETRRRRLGWWNQAKFCSPRLALPLQLEAWMCLCQRVQIGESWSQSTDPLEKYAPYFHIFNVGLFSHFAQLISEVRVASSLSWWTARLSSSACNGHSRIGHHTLSPPTQISVRSCAEFNKDSEQSRRNTEAALESLKLLEPLNHFKGSIIDRRHL